MIIRHVTPVGEIQGEPTGFSASFLRGNHDWYSQFNLGRTTRYEGWFLTNQEDQPHQYWKFLERVALFPKKTQLPIAVHCTPGAYRQDFPDGTSVVTQICQNLILHGGMAIRANKQIELEITLDMRGIYLQPKENRNYTIEKDENGYLVSYTDPLLNGKQLFFALQSPETLGELDPTWKEVHYGRDARRNSEPSNLYAFTLGHVAAQNLFLGIGFTAAQARAGAKAASNLDEAPFAKQKTAGQTEVTHYLAQKALSYLKVSSGYYAGFPWFHQHWSRDELLTALGLPHDEQIAMLERYLDTQLHQGELPTYVGSGTYCADGVGWLSLLASEIGIDTLSQDIRQKLTAFLKQSVTELAQYRKNPSGLIWSGHNSTWMDTIGRTGYCIEVQAMFGLSLGLLAKLTGDADFEQQRKEHLATVRHILFHDHLHDGLHEDMSLNLEVRPNIFLAYLLQPDLLSREEWERSFEYVLTHCETPWGGLSSLGFDDPKFQPQSTGENNISYHQGDSWFHINCLAALALHRCNAQKYKQDIIDLTESTCSELLWQHYLGCPGEIASAETGASWGCGIQGFAGGPLIALLKERSTIQTT